MAKFKMIGRLLVIAVCFAALGSFAAGDAVQMESAQISAGNVASLQRGARNFMNYCSGCHSAKYVRYNTVGKYLELSEKQLIDNLMFNAEKTFETIRTAMPAADAAGWFGKAPPDLSLMARAKGADYVYNFLKGFYLDPGSPTGVDNRVLAGTSMPHVLWELQGFQKALYNETTQHDETIMQFEGFEQVTSGTIDAEDYEDFVRDTVNFLAYVAEPVRAERRRLGIWVLIYLAVFLVVAALLKKQIWKDVS